MSIKEGVEDILSDVTSDAVVRKESEASKLEDRINLSTSQLSIIGASKTERDNMESKDEKLVKELEEQKRLIHLQMLEIEKTGENFTENQIHLRNLRMKRRLLSQDLRTTLERINEEQYEEECRTKATTKSTKIREDINNAFTTYTDEVKLTKETRPQFTRNITMIGKYQDSINQLNEEINKLRSYDTSSMTQQSKSELEIKIHSKAATIKTFIKEYEKHHHELMLTGDEKQITLLIETFQRVMEISNGVEAKLKQDEENKKKQLALEKTGSLEAVKIEKFSGQGDNKYLKYYIWYTEFSELVLKREYSDNIKLKFLKQYTEKDAHELVKNYHHPQELITAFKTLDEHYGKPAMVIRESLRSLRMMETIRDISNVKANRALLSKINTNISTLKCYNFDLEGYDVENSTFLIDMEEKVPHIVYTKWEEQKTKIKEEGDDITIEGFIDFYTNLVNIEEKAQYVRKQARPEDKPPAPRGNNRLSLHHGSITPQNNKRPDHGKPNQYKQNINGRFNGNIQGRFNQQNRGTQQGGPSTPRYCIFCETNTHDTGFCRVSKYTAEYKTQQCQKHNACYMCFKTGEHKANTCPRIMKCRLCPRMHHFNNHTRKEIDEYYKKKKKKPNGQ